MKVVNVRVDELISILHEFKDNHIEFVDITVIKEDNKIRINPSPEVEKTDPNDFNNLIV